MKQNKYDDAAFFEAYSRMDRSQGGLAAAGEWPALEKLLPAFEGARVLDLGCGYGWHCVYAALHGAKRVLGIDLSDKMLAVARDKSAGLPIEYQRCAIEDYDYPAAAFDVVLSSLAFHYVKDFDAICKKVAKTLAPGGVFVFSAEHPVFTAQGGQQWVDGDDGEHLYWPVDRYFDEGEREAIFLGQPVTKYHRTVAGYIQPLLQNGFAVTALVEPQPTAEHLKTVPGMADELRRPMMLLVAAQKA